MSSGPVIRGFKWRMLVPTVLWVAYSLNLLIYGDPRTRRFVLLAWALLGGIYALVFWARRRPDHPAVRLLFMDRSPRTDDPELTKSGRYRLAFVYLGVGVLALGLLFLVVQLLTSVRSNSGQTVLVVLLPFVIFPAGMGILGGLYLLVRTRFRSDES
jgi:peptidoglycan/LPS O-acetylase OafA/YrhL